MEPKADALLRTFNFHVEIPRRDPDRSGFQLGSMHGFANTQGTYLFEALGKKLCKQRGHVLNDEDGDREVGRQGGEQLHEGIGTSGRNADDDNIQAASVPWFRCSVLFSLSLQLAALITFADA